MKKVVYKMWNLFTVKYPKCRIKILGHIPKTHFHVACSGGTDSMVLLDFLRRFPKNKFDVLHFNHGTKYCPDGERTVTEYCLKYNIELHVGRIQNPKQNGCSLEQYWRNERYSFFEKFKDEPILMAHNLNDCIETYIMTCMQGIPRIIPYYNDRWNVIRPFLLVPKTEINNWIKRHHLRCSVDGSNFDTTIPRNLVRHKMMKLIKILNPGIEKTISKKILENYKENENGKRTH